ncbi:MAG: DUF4031 domain-containing protein [Streptosporangiaceae bacterium]
MTVYAYKMRHQARFGAPTISDPWFNLTAGTQDELHAFAAKLGLPGQVFQPDSLIGPQQAPVSWDYTVTEGERDRAIELGAQAITHHELARIERQRAAGPGII